MDRTSSPLGRCRGKRDSVTFRAIALILVSLHTLSLVTSAFADSLARPASAEYWIGRTESELVAAWGLPDDRQSQPDGSSQVVYKAGRTIGGFTLKMEQSKRLFDDYTYNIDSKGVIINYSFKAQLEPPKESHPWLIFFTGVVAGIVITLAAVVIALQGIYVAPE